MPGLLNSRLRYALHCLKELDAANDQYRLGGSEIDLALARFDLVWPNLVNVMDALSAIARPILASRRKDISVQLHTVIELCNVFPDSGAHLFNLRLGPQERKRWLRIALEASRFLGNDVTTQAHLGNLGLAEMDGGNPRQALQDFEQALEITRMIGDQAHEATWLGNLGNAYAALGKHHQAIAYHEQHLKLAKAVGDRRGESHALGNLGVSYAFLGREDEAVHFYERHLALSRELGDRRSEAHALLNLGFAYYDVRQLDRAKTQFEASSRVAEEIQDLTIGQLAQGGIADVLIDQGDYRGASQLLEKTITLARGRDDRSSLLHLLGSFGNVLNVQGNLDTALRQYDEQLQLARIIGSRGHECNALCNLTSIYRKMGKRKESLKAARAGIRIARELESLQDESFLSWQMGLIYEQAGNLEKAVECFAFTVAYELRTNNPDAEKDALKLKMLQEQLMHKPKLRNGRS